MSTIVTAKELGQFLKLTESTIYNLASSGEIPGFRVGRSWRFYMDEVLESIGINNGEGKLTSLLHTPPSCPA
jgi:excisionase family DNA binding protein